MQLDLAQPELKIFFCSLTCDLVTGRPLALKLRLSRRNRQVQLQDGQLRLCKVLPHKNLAECLTKNLSTASFHRLLPKLMVHTRAVKAQALLTRLGGENQASFCSSSFFTGMVVLIPPMAQTRASSTDLSLQLPSLTEWEKEPEKTLAFPELATEQLQKRIASRKSLQCQKLTQLSFDSLTDDKLELGSPESESLTDDKLELGSPESESLTDDKLELGSPESESLTDDKLELGSPESESLTDDKLELGRPESESLSEQLRRKNSDSFSDQLCTMNFQSFTAQLCRKNNPASEQLLQQQLRQQQPASQEHLSQLRLQDPASAISRQLPKESWSTAGLQKAAWPAATLTDNLSFTTQTLSEQDLSDRNFEQNRFFQKNFGHRISEKQLQQNLPRISSSFKRPTLPR